ncbi:3-keto-5-aminohexanoate cleavage protein, partial [Blautia glucerasea]
TLSLLFVPPAEGGGMEIKMRKVIISLAPVQAGTSVDAVKLAEDVEKSVKLGAAMCHLHCRKPDGSLTPDISYMSECFDEILKRTDVVVQASTGGVSDMNIQDRCNPLDYPKVESASLNGGSTNLGEAVYINSFDDIRYCADAVYKRGILPETEVFDIGMLHNMAVVKSEQPFADPMLFNLVFGHKGGMQPTPEMLAAFRSFVPSDALWGVTHFGRDNWTFLAAAIAMGATVVRVGFEDSHYLEDGVDAKYNWQVVEKLVNLIRAMGLEPATPDEARQMLKLRKR